MKIYFPKAFWHLNYDSTKQRAAFKMKKITILYKAQAAVK